MECLRDLVGIRGCGASAPASSLFVNDLDGITLADLQTAAHDEQQTFLGVWNACVSRAIGRMAMEIPKAFSRNYRLKTSLRSIDLLRRIRESETTPAAAKWRGVSAELTLANSYWVPSTFQVVYLSSFSLFVPVAITGTVQVKLFDLELQTTLDTFTLTNPAQGWNEVKVEKSYSVYRLALAYDSTLIDSVYQMVPMYAIDSWISAAMYIYGPQYGGWIKGIESADLANGMNTFTQGNSTFGLSMKLSFQCRWDHLICENRMMFSYPMLYLLAGELMSAMVYTPELTRFNTVDRNDAEKLIAQYYGEFTASLATACEGIALDTSDACMECNAQYQFTESIP